MMFNVYVCMEMQMGMGEKKLKHPCIVCVFDHCSGNMPHIIMQSANSW